MRIGVPREIKEMENRVGVTPAGVSELIQEGHQVFVEIKAGVGSGFSDQDYKEAVSYTHLTLPTNREV